ncbi:MAG: type III-B CRISPR module RAMP protein Cmr1 [bacterium]|nr:type III-B CRISPR module RAMP protein Cmr1 [bacterium]
MYKVPFDLETVTPLFMAGADGRTPELRTPSFKGMLRFWWRAMRADDNIQHLAEQEAKLFGGTGKDQGRSKMVLRFLKFSIGGCAKVPMIINVRFLQFFKKM